MSSPNKSVSWMEAYVVSALVTGAILALFGWSTVRTGDSPSTKAGATTTSGAPLTTSMTWPPLALDAAKIDAAREAYHGATEHLLTKPEIIKLHTLARSINDHQFTTAPIPTRTGEELSDALAYALSDVYALLDTRTQFVPMGEPMYKACNEGIAQLQAAIANKSITLERALEDPDFETYPLYRRNCGKMLPELIKRGIMKEDATWASEDGPVLANLLQRYRWASMAMHHTEPLGQLSPLERELFTRWRVQDGKAYPLARRREHLKELRIHAKDFPQGVARALLEYEDGNKARAAEILSRLKNQSPDDPTYAAMYDALEKELSEDSKK